MCSWVCRAQKSGRRLAGTSMAAALCEGWWGRGMTGIMGGTCTGGRTVVSPKVTFLSLSRGSFTTVFHGDLGIHQ